MLWEMYESLAKASDQFLLYRHGAHQRLVDDMESMKYSKECNALRFDIQNSEN